MLPLEGNSGTIMPNERAVNSMATMAIRYAMAGMPCETVNPSKFDMGAMMSAVSLCALSYVGFGSIVTLDDECVQPKKGPGKAMIIIVLILGFLYMSMSFLTMCMDPSGNIMIANQNSGFYAVAGLAGKWLGVLCAVANALALGLFTSLSGTRSPPR